mgnify:FL=1
MKISITDAILEINPSAVVNVSGTDIDNCEIEWLEDTTPISKADIKAKLKSMAYIDNRKNEYPTWQEQMDLQYWDKVNGTSTWQEKINEIKNKYPKE